MSEPAVPVFRSDVETPEALLARVRARLAGERSEQDPALVDPVFDLATGLGLLEGWYHAEEAGGSVHRWTARRFSFEATVRHSTHLALTALVLPESGLTALYGRLAVDDVPGPGFELRAGLNELLVPLPPAPGGRSHFEIDLGVSFCPARAGLSPDTRELGVSVRRLALVRDAAPATWRERALSVPGTSTADRVRRRLRLALAALRPWRRLAELEARAAALERRVVTLAASERSRAADCALRSEELREDLHRKLAARTRD